MSLAAGVDFGNIVRLNLPQDLSPVEKLVISKSRSFMEVFQLVSPTGSASASQRGLRGHIITINHNSAEAVAQVLPRVDTSTLQVIYVGSRQSWKHRFQREARSLSEMRVRVDVIYHWLDALKHLNPLYHHVTIDHSVAMKLRLEAFPDQLLADVHIADSALAEKLQRESTSDVSQLVSSSEDEERVSGRHHQVVPLSHKDATGTMIREGREQSGGGDQRVSSTTDADDTPVMPLSCDPCDSKSNSDADSDSDYESESRGHGDCEDVKGDIGGPDYVTDIEGHLARDMVSTLVPVLITDSASDQLAMNGVNPSANLISIINKHFGEATSDHKVQGTVIDTDQSNITTSSTADPSKKGLDSTPKSSVRCIVDDSTLIKEFSDNDTIIYGSCPHLFLLGKGLQGRKGSVNRNFSSLLMKFYDSRFQRDHRLIFLLFNQLQRHEATRAVAKLGVKNCSKSITEVIEYVTSPSFKSDLKEAVEKPDGKASKKILKVLGPHIRVAGGQIPFSPGARSKCLGELLAMTHLYGLPSFFVTISPADLDAVLIIELAKPAAQALSGDASAIRQSIRLPDLADRAKLLAENPGHAAAVFHHLMEAISSALYRLDPEAGRRKSNPPVSERECSILGIPVGFYGVYETQGRGSLHIHTAVWGGLPPELLVKLAHDPIFAREVSIRYIISNLSDKLYDYN